MRIQLISLGCSKNLVDSEKLLFQLQQGGHEVCYEMEEGEFPDIVIINTCGFIGDAKEESIDTILEAVQAKNRGDIREVHVFGCLSERYKDELRNEIPEVDSYFGARSLQEVVEGLNLIYYPEHLNKRILSTPGHTAYLKIAEGCNWGCAFCAIPLIRGKYVSIPIEEVVAEAARLAQQGVKELLVVAQDATYYGLDLYAKRNIADLLHALSEISGIEWIRLHYAYPCHFPEDLIQEMQHNPKICHYLDIPFQHISDKVLKKMHRGNNKQDAVALIHKLRAQIPDIALRTTMLVGHPGEDESAFEELLDFVRSAKFERLGVFPYSHEEGTFGGKHYKDDIPYEVKQDRVNRIMDVQQKISQQLNLAKVGKKFRILIDQLEGKYWIGRSEYDSPGVDNEVLIPIDESQTHISIGEFYWVEITDATEFDLFGKFC